jgi:cytochrome b561
MQLRNSATGYGAVALSAHWLTVALVALAWLVGMFGEELADAAGVLAHVSLGLAFVVLLVLRLGWRLFDPPPPLEATRFGPWLNGAARLSHVVLYALLIAVPLAGILLQFARGEAIPVFGLFDIASPWIKDRALARSLNEMHETLANLLLIVAAVHAAAALAHHWLLRDRTLARMLPRGNR